jgi:hypothetical protein
MKYTPKVRSLKKVQCDFALIVIITTEVGCELILSPSILVAESAGLSSDLSSMTTRKFHLYFSMNLESKAAQNVTQCVSSRGCAGRSNRAFQQIAEVEAKLHWAGRHLDRRHAKSKLHSEASNYDLLSSTTTHLDNTRSSSEDS